MDYLDEINELKDALEQCDAVVIGAGSGLSTSAGFTYTGERFEKYFYDFIKRYHFTDMYSGGFYNFISLEEHWGYWSRYIYINRYMDPPKPVYQELYNLVKDKNYFVLTTNVDHCFQKAGFDKERLFYTQGDYGLFQCSHPCHNVTYDNYEIIKKMVLAQGFSIDEDGNLYIPEGVTLKRTVPSALLPYCPKCGKPMSMNLRADATFVEDKGWYHHNDLYSSFMKKYMKKKIVYMDLGTGGNTPGIIKYPFWRYTYSNKKATYCCINYGDALAPGEIKPQSILFNEDIGTVLQLLEKENL